MPNGVCSPNMAPFEPFYCETRKLPIEDSSYSSFDNYNFWNKLNISKEEFLALKGLSSNRDIILQKADKGNSVVLVIKVGYVKRMKELFRM